MKLALFAALALVCVPVMASAQASASLNELTDQDIRIRGGSDHACEAWFPDGSKPFFRDVGTQAFVRWDGKLLHFAPHHASPSLPYLSVGAGPRVRITFVVRGPREGGEEGEYSQPVDLVLQTPTDRETIRGAKLVCS